MDGMGALLNLSSETVSNIERLDKRIENLSKNTPAAAASMKDFANAVKSISNNGERAATNLNKVAHALSRMDTSKVIQIAQGLLAASQHAGDFARNVTQAAKALNRMGSGGNSRRRTSSTPSSNDPLLDSSNAFRNGVTVSRHKELRKALISQRDIEGSSEEVKALNAAILEHTKRINEATRASKNLQNAHKGLWNIGNQLARQFALMFSVSSIANFVKSIAQVTGNFELQRVALESILQNRSKADEIFNKTVQLAVKSPFRIQQLVTYTKQLAAYRIESDKLYDTTKRLADVSAGLGVDMQRLILAYGQVKAAAYLRGQEVRQFTEAGINLYAELKELYKERDGQDYSTGQIVKMISDRKVVFEDVEAVFKRLTDQGGIFYNMQEVQAQTLLGMLSNLKDSWDVMLNDIGSSTGGILKGGVSLAKTLLDNWDNVVAVAGNFLTMLALMHFRGSATFKELSRRLTLFNTEFRIGIALGQRWAGMISGLKVAFKGLGSLIGSFIGSAFLFQFISLLTELWAKSEQYASKIAEINKRYEEQLAALNKLYVAYLKVGKVAREVAEQPLNGLPNKKSDSTLDLEEKRKYLQQIIDKYNEAGADVKIDVENLSGKRLDALVNKYYNEYIVALNAERSFAQQIADEEDRLEWGGLLGNNANQDIKDLNSAISKFESMAGEASNAVLRLGKSFGVMSDEQREAYQELTKEKEGETIYERIKRQEKGVTDLANALYNAGKISKLTRANIAAIFEQSIEYSELDQDVTDAEKEAKKEIKGITDAFKAANPKWREMSKVAIQIAVNKAAIDNSWGEIARRFALKEFGIDFKVNEDSIISAENNIDNELTNFFNNREYKIKLSVGEAGDIGSGLIQYGKQVDNLASKYNALKNGYEDWVRAHGKGSSPMAVTQEEAELVYGKGNVPSIFRRTQKKQNIFDFATNSFKDQGTTMIEIPHDKVAEYGRKLLASQALALNELGYKGKDKNGRKTNKIIKEQIQLVEKLNQEYEKLRETRGEIAARDTVMKNNREAILHSGLKFAKGYIPNDKQTADYLGNVIYPKAKDFSDRQDVLSSKAQHLNDIELEKYKDNLEKAQRGIEDLTSKYELFKKLRDQGLSDREIESLIPEKLPHSIEAVNAGVLKLYDNLRDENGKLGTENEKALKDFLAKQKREVIKEHQETLTELAKQYAEMLDEQSQLDVHYLKEYRKIVSEVKDPALRDTYLGNLNKQYKEKTAKNKWESFKGSDTYIRMFEDMDSLSNKTLDRMTKELERMKGELKDLDPTALKTVVEQMRKIRNEKMERNPFGALINNLKKIRKLKKQGLTEDVIDAKMIENERKIEEAQNRISAVNSIINIKENENKFSTEEDAKVLQKYPEYASLTVQELQKIKDKQKGIISNTKEENAGLQNNKDVYDDTRKSIQATIQALERLNSQIQSILSTTKDTLEALGANLSVDEELMFEMAGTIADITIKTIEFGLAMKAAGVAAKSALGVVGYILMALEAIISIVGMFAKAHDKKLDKRISAVKDHIDDLQRSYEKLHKAMQSAWDTSSILDYQRQSKEALQGQITSYQSMIRLEEEKKNTDQSKIKEYRQAIEDIRETLKAQEAEFVRELGGFGDSENMKSAAQEFADAWVEAFESGENALDALNGKMDEYISNLIKKQAMLRVAKRYLEPVFKAIDNSVAEDSLGGINLVKSELDVIKYQADNATKGMNEAMKTLMESLGYTGNRKSELSALQQGIQGVTEQTAEAIEAYLNSMRFFLAGQRSDVAAILALLQAQYNMSSVDSGPSPTLIELKAQTALIRSIDRTFTSVVARRTNGGYGVKIIM